MFKKISNSLKNINYKLFIALLVMGLCPTIYTTLRIFWLGELPDGYSYSIAGQLSWVNLIYEVISEAIILPLFYFIGKVILDKKELVNRVKTGLIITLGLYVVISGIVFVFAEELLKAMAISPDILEMSVDYIRLESIANIFSVLANFVLIVLVTCNKDKYVYLLTGIKLILLIILDIFLISSFKASLNLGVKGIAISNIIINIIMFVVTLFILKKVGVNIFNKDKLNFTWAKELLKVGGISGVESLVRNLFYMIMISRMVNVVGEQGTYWVANNFIWGWLLLPIIQLGELIKQEVATNKENIKKNTLGYFTITIIICLIWLICIPLYKPFMMHILNFTDVDKLFNLVMVLLGFYILYAFQNIFDSTFYGLGKTNYMLFKSIVTNVFYYGTYFVLYITHVYEPTPLSIVLMFCTGTAFDSLVSGGIYYYMMKKYLKDIKKQDRPKRKINSMSKYNDYIRRYVESEKSNNAMMLNGSWGSGKSYYIKNELKPFLEKEYNIDCIIISLYGIKDFDEIYKTIYLECKFGSFCDTSEDIKKIYIGGKAIAKGLIGKYLIDINIDDKDLKDLYKSIDLKNKLIIFEDIERSTINKEVILGLINNLVENNNVKVLIVANEKEIINKKNNYLLYKEKTIFDTINFQSNQYESIESIMLSYENAKFQKMIEINLQFRYDNIIEIMKEVEHYNYRAIIFACNKVIDIFDIIENIDVRFFDFVFYGVIAYSLRKNMNSKLVWKNEKSGNELGTTKYPLLKYCYEYIESQLSNADDLNKLQKEYIDKITKEEEEKILNKHIDILSRYYEFTEEEVSTAASKIILCIKENTINPSLYAKIIGTLISLKNIVKNINKKNVDECKKYILKNLKEVNNKDKIYEELKFNSFLEFSNSNNKAEYSAFIDQIMNVLNNTRSLNIDCTIEGFDNIRKNIVNFSDKVMKMNGFAKYLNTSDICNLLKISTPLEIQIIRSCFVMIYRQIVINEEFIADIPYLDQLRKEIKNLIINNMYTDNISK